MACVVRVIENDLFRRILLRRNKFVSWKLFSTSSVNAEKDKAITTSDQSPYTPPPDFSKPLANKNWVSYGFDYENRQEDTFEAHFLAFIVVTYITVFGGVIFMYFPDASRKDWARREAFIRLYEREMLGLDPIDPNYVDPEKVELPTDEELGDMEIII